MHTKVFQLEPKRRDVILNAALKQFILRGFDDASTNVIAKEAGISKALMFHYVNNKQELFLLVYDYFTELLEKEYFQKIDFSERDIFSRLRQSYLLQIDLIKHYPSVLEFEKLSIVTKSEELNKELEKRASNRQSSCDLQIFDHIDTSRFRDGLNIEKCKQFILWTNVGFTNQILDNIRDIEASTLNDQSIIAILDENLEELRKLFYR